MRRDAYDSRRTREMQERITHDAMAAMVHTTSELQCHFNEPAQLCTRGFRSSRKQDRVKRNEPVCHAYFTES